MENNVKKYLNDLLVRYPVLKNCEKDILDTFNILEKSYLKGGKLLLVGNGGSAADSEHIVGELMKSFKLRRHIDEEYKKKLISIDKEKGSILAKNLQGSLPAIALDGHPALSTAYMNDCVPVLGFAQQVSGFGNENDVLFCISTSGNSENVIYAAVVAKAKNMKVIGLTGEKISKLSKISDACINAPEVETFKIQELHLPIYHCLCLMLEERFFGLLDIK